MTLSKRLVIELIGTFFLVFTIAATGNPLAIAGILTAMIYMGGSISGAHYNPAVTLAVTIAGGIKSKDAAFYMGVQVLGSLAACLLYYNLAQEFFLPKPSELATVSSAISMELLFTFILAFTVLQVAVSEKTSGNSYFGAAIGLVVMTGVFAGGLSGGVYNPAVALGAYLADYGSLSDQIGTVFLYLSATTSGGLLAGLLYRYVYASDQESQKKKRSFLKNMVRAITKR